MFEQKQEFPHTNSVFNWKMIPSELYFEARVEMKNLGGKFIPGS